MKPRHWEREIWLTTHCTGNPYTVQFISHKTCNIIMYDKTKLNASANLYIHKIGDDCSKRFPLIEETWGDGIYYSAYAIDLSIPMG